MHYQLLSNMGTLALSKDPVRLILWLYLTPLARELLETTDLSLSILANMSIICFSWYYVAEYK